MAATTSLSMCVAALLLLLPCALCATWQWNGGTTNFSDSSNWANGALPAAADTPACLTNMQNNRLGGIVSQLDATTYRIGQVLQLPLGGTLLFSRPTTLSFSPPTACTPSLIYNFTTGLVREQRNDFYCHKNWVIADSGVAPTPSKSNVGSLVPCAGDTAIFPASAAYNTYLSSSVSLVTMASIQLGDNQAVNTNAMLNQLAPEITFPPNTITLQPGGFRRTCVPAFQNYSLAGIPTCACFSSCLDAPLVKAAQAIVRNNQKTAALATLAAQTINTTRAVTAVFGAAALMVDPPSLIAFGNNQSLAAAAILAAMQTISAVATQPKISIVNNNLVVSLTVSGPAALFYAPNSATLLPSPISYTFTAPASSSTSASLTRLQDTLRRALIVSALNFASPYIVSSTLAANSQLPSAVQALISLFSQIPSDTATDIMYSVGANNPCFSSCTSDCDTCTTLAATVETEPSISSTLANTIASALIAAKNASFYSNLDWDSSATKAILNAISQFGIAESYSAAAVQQTPVYVTASSPTILFNAAPAPTETQLFTVSPQNLIVVVNSIAQALIGFQKIDYAWGVTVGYTEESSSRRRSATYGNTVQFSYRVFCPLNDTSCIAISNNFAASIAAQLTAAVTSISFTAQTCFSANEWDADTGCLQAAASSTCKRLTTAGWTESNARSYVQSYLYNLTVCGSAPTFPNGQCFDTSFSATALQLSNEISQNCSCYNPPPPAATGASTSSGSSSSVVVVAAIMGVIIALLAIALFVVWRRRRMQQMSMPKEDRSIVAFNNPVYDQSMGEPTVGTTQYHLGGNNSEGIYDEPAFAMGKSDENPYDSIGSALRTHYLDVSPHMASSETDDAGKGQYLDVADIPNPSKERSKQYLDVSAVPNPADETKQYLDVAPLPGTTPPKLGRQSSIREYDRAQAEKAYMAIVGGKTPKEEAAYMDVAPPEQRT